MEPPVSKWGIKKDGRYCIRHFFLNRESRVRDIYPQHRSRARFPGAREGPGTAHFSAVKRLLGKDRSAPRPQALRLPVNTVYAAAIAETYILKNLHTLL